MTSFGWKRKSSQLSSAPAVFTPPDQDDQDKEEEEEVSDPDFDWIAVAKRRRVAALEDNRTLFLRLKQEGEVLSLHSLCIFIIYYLHTKVLAEQERFWQAINRWDNALALDPTGDIINTLYSGN